jgi:hypothetical protein
MRGFARLPLALLLVLAVAAPANATGKRAFFLSPTGNISCELHWKDARLPSTAYCQTRHPARSVTLRANGRLRICTGRNCIGDPPSNAKVLRYGSSMQVGGFRCTSRSTGMTCVRTTTGKGFRISIAGVRRV